jgi:hypothetical protein
MFVRTRCPRDTKYHSWLSPFLHGLFILVISFTSPVLSSMPWLAVLIAILFLAVSWSGFGVYEDNGSLSVALFKVC